MLTSGNGWDQPFDFGIGNMGAVHSGANAGPGERIIVQNPELAAIFGVPVGQTVSYDSLSDSQRAAMLEEERQRKKRMEEIARHELNNKWKKMAMYTAGLATMGSAFGAGGWAYGGAAGGTVGTTAATTGGTVGTTTATGGSLGAGSLGLSSGATPVAGMGSAFGAGGSAGLGTASAGLAAGGGGVAALGGAAASAAPVAAAAAPAASTGGWLSGAMKWSLANKNWISGLLTAVGTAYSQSNQKKLARQQYDYANSVLQQQRDYYAQQQEAIRNSPSAQMAPYLMEAVLKLYGQRLAGHNVPLPLDEILGRIRSSTGR